MQIYEKAVVDFPHLFGAFGAAFLAGAINSVAGGGTMLSFPILIALGLPPVVANATNTVGIWPGSIGSILGFRRELGRVPSWIKWLLLPALAGGALGALLLCSTPATVFERLAPWLVLFASALFGFQGRLRTQSHDTGEPQGKILAGGNGGRWLALAFGLEFCVALYGGYFGAGMSIMSLAILAFIGMRDILEMSAITSLLGLGINGTAALIFSIAGLVSWPHALAMTLGALAGGYGAAGIARKIGRVAVRRFVVCVGVTIAAALFWRMLASR